MHTDPRRQAQALEFLFLFNACKLTNHRPDQSVSLADVARVAGLTQDQSEQLCTSLREARLIRYSSLLGDISVTRFGVSEVVTTKACPHSGANYFPAVRQMGLRFSRGHHLFDDLELSRARGNESSPLEQSEDILTEAQSSSTTSSGLGASGAVFNQSATSSGFDSGVADGVASNPVSGIRTRQISKSIGDYDQQKTASQVRQEVIAELEQLLEQIGGTTGGVEQLPQQLRQQLRQQPPHLQRQKPQQALQQTTAPDTTSQVAANSANSRAVNAASTPSLLLNPEWKPGFKLQGNGQNARITKQPTRAGILAEKIAVESSAKLGRDEMNGQDVSLSVEKLHELMQNWCQTVGRKKAQASHAGDFLVDLEQINESLFSFT